MWIEEISKQFRLIGLTPTRRPIDGPKTAKHLKTVDFYIWKYIGTMTSYVLSAIWVHMVRSIQHTVRARFSAINRESLGFFRFLNCERTFWVKLDFSTVEITFRDGFWREPLIFKQSSFIGDHFGGFPFHHLFVLVILVTCLARILPGSGSDQF